MFFQILNPFFLSSDDIPLSPGFPSKLSFESLGRSSISFGNDVNLLMPRLSSLRFLQRPISFGIDVNLLSPKSSSSRFLRRPISFGNQ